MFKTGNFYVSKPARRSSCAARRKRRQIPWRTGLVPRCCGAVPQQTSRCLLRTGARRSGKRHVVSSITSPLFWRFCVASCGEVMLRWRTQLSSIVTVERGSGGIGLPECITVVKCQGGCAVHRPWLCRYFFVVFLYRYLGKVDHKEYYLAMF